MDNTQNKVRRPEQNGESDYKVVFKVTSGVGFSSINPLKLALELKKELSHVSNVSILRNGMMSIICVSAKQQDKALKLKKIMGKAVQAFKPSTDKQVKGVIYNVCVEVTEQELLENLKGCNVIDVKRMGRGDNGRGTTPVLLTFKDDKLPSRVMLGYSSYIVREYERPPLRCFKCQRFGHVVAVCEGKRRCRRCGKDHDGKECIDVPKCCNCGGDHPASYRGCPNYVRAEKVEKVKKDNKLSYAEAVKQVDKMRVEVQVQAESQFAGPSRTVSVADQDTLIISKKALLAFRAEAMWRVKNVAVKKSDAVREVSAAAERLLGYKEINPQEIWELTRSQGSQSERLGFSQALSLGDSDRELAEMRTTDGEYEDD